MKNILNISLKTRCFPHVSFRGNLLGAFLPRQGSGIASQPWLGRAPTVCRYHTKHPRITPWACPSPLAWAPGRLQHRDGAGWWCSSDTATWGACTTLPPPCPSLALPVHHSSRPGLHRNSAPGVVLILQIYFSRTFIRKHKHGNSHLIQLSPRHTWIKHHSQIMLLFNHFLWSLLQQDQRQEGEKCTSPV